MANFDYDCVAVINHDAPSPPLEPSRRIRFDWVFPALFRPRQTFANIAAQAGGVWLVPILVLMGLAAAREIVAGSLRQAAILGQPPNLPPNFQSFSPEQQAQFQQAQGAASGPLFVYVFPTIVAVLGTWVGWLLVAGLLHLALTLLGGRGATRSAMNLVAWASLPFAVRDGVRIVYMLLTRELIGHPGLSGFAPADGGGFSALLTGLLGLIDLYLIWHVALLVRGVRASQHLSPAKAWGGVTLTLLIVLLLQALPAFIFSRLGALVAGRF